MSEPVNLIVSQTAGPISMKFSRKAQLKLVGKIAIASYLYPCPGAGIVKNTKSWTKHITKLFTKQKMFKIHPSNARYPQLVKNKG